MDSTILDGNKNAPVERTDGPATRSGVSADLIGVTELAVMLSCSPRHVARLAKAGKLPAAVKLGRLTRWSRAAITVWIAGGCKPVRIPGGRHE